MHGDAAACSRAAVSFGGLAGMCALHTGTLPQACIWPYETCQPGEKGGQLWGGRVQLGSSPESRARTGAPPACSTSAGRASAALSQAAASGVRATTMAPLTMRSSRWTSLGLKNKEGNVRVSIRVGQCQSQDHGQDRARVKVRVRIRVMVRVRVRVRSGSMSG